MSILDAEVVGDAVRYGSNLIPLFDAAHSSAIDWARFNPITGNAVFHFKEGGSVTHSCSVLEWVAYKFSDSRGQHYNEFFRGMR